MVTQQLGLLGGFFDGIADFFGGIIDGIKNFFGGWFYAIQTFFYKLFYEILKALFLVIDFISLIFRKIVGLDTVKINGSVSGISVVTDSDGGYSGDLTYALLQSQAVREVFFSLLIVAIILLFVFTFIAIIRNQYNATDSKTKGSNGPIIGKALKALFSFIFVPAICMLGLFVSNGLLKTIDGATKIGGTETTISGQIFVAAGAQANRIISSDEFYEFFISDEGKESLNPNGMFTPAITISSMNEEQKRAYYASLVNKSFASQSYINSDKSYVDIQADTDLGEGDTFLYLFHNSVGEINRYDYMNTRLVNVYFNLGEFNWLIAFIACFIITGALFKASIGVVGIIYELILLFCISPPFVAMMPLDEGKGFGRWRQMFVTRVLIAYGTIVAINFFFIITPILLSIDLFYSPAEIETFGQTLVDLFNAYGHMLFVIVGALMIQNTAGWLTNLITNDKAESLMKSGGDMIGGIRSSAQNMLSRAEWAKSVPARVKNLFNWKKDGTEAPGAYNPNPGGNGGGGNNGAVPGGGRKGGSGGSGSSGGRKGGSGESSSNGSSTGGGLKGAASRVRNGINKTAGWVAGTRLGQTASKHIAKPISTATSKVADSAVNVGGKVKTAGRDATDKVRGGLHATRDVASAFRTNHLTTSFGVARKLQKLENGNAADKYTKEEIDKLKTRKEQKAKLAEYEQLLREATKNNSDREREEKRAAADENGQKVRASIKSKIHNAFVTDDYGKQKQSTKERSNIRKDYKANPKKTPKSNSRTGRGSGTGSSTE